MPAGLTVFTSRKLAVLRLLAVISIVWFHAARFGLDPAITGGRAAFVPELFSQVLMRWGMPFLGSLSGYLFFRTLVPSFSGYVMKYRRRARSLLLPFLLWSRSRGRVRRRQGGRGLVDGRCSQRHPPVGR